MPRARHQCRVAQRLVLVGGQRKEDELGADRLRRGEPVEMLLGHAGHQDHGAGMDARAAPADAAGGGRGHHRKRGDEIGREILVVEARHVQLAGRNHGGGAAVHVIADPADGVLRRRPFAEHRMDMAVDQARHHRAAAGVEHGVGLGIGGRIERRDACSVDQQRLHRGLRPRDVAGEELADVLDEKRGHSVSLGLVSRAQRSTLARLRASSRAMVMRCRPGTQFHGG